MGKYKYRLSYEENGVLIPIKLENIEYLTTGDMTDIKDIDNFTTMFYNLEELLFFLKSELLIPQDTYRLFITFDKKNGKKVEQQLYAYPNKIFYEKEKGFLNSNYIYSVIINNAYDGKFIQDIVLHLNKKYDNRRNFSNIDRISKKICEFGNVLTPTETKLYYCELERLIDKEFYKKKNKKTVPNYKNIRDFICFFSGEKPIITKKKKEETKVGVVIAKTIEDEEYIEPTTVTYREYKEDIKGLIKSGKEEKFEAYLDGNDWIAPISNDDIERELSFSAKKLCLRKDSGLWE